VRDVGVVAGVLDDADRGGAGLEELPGQRERRVPVVRQVDPHRVGELAGEQRGVGGGGGGGRAGTRRPAVPQPAAAVPAHGLIVPGPRA
jgi:hypothetical protein